MAETVALTDAIADLTIRLKAVRQEHQELEETYNLLADAICTHLNVDEDDVAEVALLIDAVKAASNREEVTTLRAENNRQYEEIMRLRAALALIGSVTAREIAP